LIVWFCSSGCTDNIFTSDHSPVFATFEVGVISQFPRTGMESFQLVSLIMKFLTFRSFHNSRSYIKGCWTCISL